MAISSLQHFRILGVEDNEINRKILALYINKESHCRLTLVETGMEAIAEFKRNKYDAIFLDLGLKDISGYEVAKSIRMIDRSIPIIAYTASDKNEALCQEAGIDDYLIKPIMSSQQIDDMLNKWVKGRASGLHRTNKTSDRH